MGELPAVIGPYRITGQLGEGGMGAVYAAVHEVIHRRVAIKVLHPEADRSTDSVNRFINEARAANLVIHPGLVQITDFGHLPDGTGFLVMEYLEGETLAKRLESSGARLSPSEAVQIGVQIASAVAAAHKKGIVHRDLKPSNLMLVPDPAVPTGERVKILDFGLAKLSRVKEAALVRTNSLAVIGTPLYMSPEQCEGAGRVDAKTDVYSLGCMLYEMLAGRPPFLGEGPGKIIGQHLYEHPEPLLKMAPSIPAPLAALVDSLLRKDKDDRPSMGEAQGQLETLAAALPPPARRQHSEAPGALEQQSMKELAPPSTLGHSAVEARRTRRRVTGTLSLLGLLGGALLLSYRLPMRHQPRGAAPAAPAAPAVRSQPPAVVADSESKPAPAAPRTIRWSIVSTPPGAALLDSQGAALGETPFTQQRPVGSGVLSIRLHKSGYADKLLNLRLDTDQDLQEQLATLRLLPSPKRPRSQPVSPPKKPKAPATATPVNNPEDHDPFSVPAIP